MTLYSDCYPHCGGEDCVCCEIHADHVATDVANSVPQDDEYDEIWEDEDE